MEGLAIFILIVSLQLFLIRNQAGRLKFAFLFIVVFRVHIYSFTFFPLGDPESVAGEYGRHSLYKMLGYFSLVGLLRLHSLLGDYYQAIKVLENIELNKKVIEPPLCED